MLKMDKSVLFLDDDLNRCARFRSKCPFADIVNTASACIERLKNNSYDIVFLDHDLGETQYQNPKEENSGSGVVRWIVEHKPDVKEFVVHSLNPVERVNMVNDLARAGYNSTEYTFIMLIASNAINRLTTI